MESKTDEQTNVGKPKLKKMVHEMHRLISMDGIIIDCNEAYAEKLGYTVDEVIGMSLDEHTPPDYRADMRKEFDEWKESKESKTLKTWIISKDGKGIETISSISSSINSRGMVAGMADIMMDFVELKTFQKYVMIRKFESLYEKSPDLYRTVNYNGTIVDCNRTYLKDLGYDSKDEVLGSNLLEHTADRSVDTLRVHMATWRKTGREKESEIWMKRKDGTEFPALLTPTNIYDDDGFMIGRNVVIKDTSKLHETKKMLSEKEKIEKMKEEFLSMVTHELKSPLTPIIGFAQALARPKLLGEMNERQMEAVNTILSNATTLKKLIGDLLDAHKLELGKMKFALKEMSVNSLMAVIEKSFQLTAQEKGVTIQCTVAGKEEIRMVSDNDRVKQVITNLVYNAVDFVPKDTGRIMITAERKDSDVVFSVKDNGIGIPPEKQKQLFAKFYQADTSHSREHGGTGLGLSICKGMVESLGGKINVESTEGEGSNFYFTLPMGKCVELDPVS